MASTFFIKLFLSLLVRASCIQLHTVPVEYDGRSSLALHHADAGTNFTGSGPAPSESDLLGYQEVNEDLFSQVPPGTAICQTLYGADSQVPFRYTAILPRFKNKVCQEQDPLFEVGHSLFDWECAHKCIDTPGCKYIMIEFKEGGVSERCLGFRECTVVESHDPDAIVSIYKRKVEYGGARRKGAFLQGFSERALKRLLLYFDFNQPLETDEDARRLPAGDSQPLAKDEDAQGTSIGQEARGRREQTPGDDGNDAEGTTVLPDDTTVPPDDTTVSQPQAAAQASAQGQAASTRRRISRRRAVIRDSQGRASGTLWNAGQGDDRVPPAFGAEGKFGGFWSFKGTDTGIRVAQTPELLDYSGGPEATIVVVYRKDGYDSNMGRIFSGPNVDLYGYTKGMAVNMNGVRCLYSDEGLYDGEFHFIFVQITFATGVVEMYRDNIHLGNGTHGDLIEEFEAIKYTFPWLIGIRYDYDTERPYDGDADEMAIFSYRFTEDDRNKYIECGGKCFDQCPDKNQALKLTFDTELFYSEFEEKCNLTCQECVAEAVTSVIANRTQIGESFIGVTFVSGLPPNEVLVMEVFISLAPCTLDTIKPRLQPLNDVLSDIRDELVRRDCIVNGSIPITLLPDYCNVDDPPANCFPAVVPEPNVSAGEYFLPPHLHPRVLITPPDLPTIRTRLAASWIAQEAKQTMQDMIELFDPGSVYGQMYQKLLTCDVTYFDTLTTVEDLLVNQRNNTEWIAYPDIYTMFMYSGLIALLDEDNNTGEELGAALACHSQFMLLVYVPEDNNILNEDCEPALGLAYDYLYNFMTPEQHAPVRELISIYTTGRVPFGTGYSGWKLGANGMGFFDGVVIQSLAIEGEEGYDILVFQNDVRKQRDYYNWGVFESGFTHEGWHYFMFSMEGGGPALLAAEIRGQGILAETNALKAMTGAFYQMSPWTTGEQVKIFSYSDGSGIGSPGRINIFFPIMKRIYPADPVVDFVYNLQLEHQEDRKLTSDWMLFGLIPNRTDWTSQEVAEAAGLSLSRFCPDSGRVIMRSDWTEDGMSVHFSARMDTYGLQKMHADINVLALFSHRRQWISDTDLAGTLKFDDEFNDYHSTILIDGLGQSGTSTMKTWPSLPGRVLDFRDHGVLTQVVGDATFAYSYYGADYACGKTSQESCTNDVGCVWDSGIWGCVKNWSVGERAPFNISTDYRWGETNEEANMKTFSYPQFFDGSARDLDSDEEKWRAQLTVCPITVRGRCWGGLYNPVRFAFRSVILVRGVAPNPHPYVIVLDDIQAQDEQQHNYTMSWQVRPHQDHWSRTYGDRDIKRWEANRYQTLKSASASEAVLVEKRVDAAEDSLEEYPELVVRLVGDPVEGPVNDKFSLVEEEGRHGQSGLISSGYQRLVVSRLTTLPKFKTIFYPRQEGDPLLVTAYNAQDDSLRVEIGSTVDVLKFAVGVGGRHVLSNFVRNGVEVDLQ